MADELTISAVKAVPAGGGYGPQTSSAPGKPEEVLGAGSKGKGTSAVDGIELSPEAQKKVAELAQADQQVRAHEAAHMAAGGGLVRGGASYSYQRGPDGKNYAVAGEVSLDASEVPNNPSATLQKAQQIRAAALAPADPSPQDRKVAAEAGAMAMRAAQELAKKVGGTGNFNGIRLNVLG